MKLKNKWLRRTAAIIMSATMVMTSSDVTAMAAQGVENCTEYESTTEDVTKVVVESKEADTIIETQSVEENVTTSETTQERSDSIPAKSAIVNALGRSAATVSKLNSGIAKVGGAFVIVYKSPIVLTGISNTFTITTPAITAISEPGIFLLTLGHTIRIARDISPTRIAQGFSVPIVLAISSTFSIVSIGEPLKVRPIKSFT